MIAVIYSTSIMIKKEAPIIKAEGLKEKLTNLSIFYKILIANTLIITAGAVGGTWLIQALHNRGAPQFIFVFVLMGLILSILVNFWILKAALRPLTALQETMITVYHGDLTARADRTMLGDPVITHFRDALNSMLEELYSSHLRLEELSTKVLSVQEEERKRVARELHDETSQALTSLMIELRMLEKADEGDRKKKIEDLWTYTSQILDGVHRLTMELRPIDLDELGLIPALRTYTKAYAEKFNLEIHFQVTGLNERLADNMEVTFYRIVQEALTNVVKHSGAASVWISIKSEDGMVMVTIKDNGSGFDMDEVVKSEEQGLGLFGMEERMSTIGGELKISTTPGQGTEIVAQSPVRTHDGG